jgi:AraC-like DNA-binding protein
MLTGINAASHRWTGSLLKRDFLHRPDQQDPLLQTLSIRYQELSYEHATKAYHWSEHVHENTELIMVKKGVYIGELNGQELELNAGHVMIVGPGDRHADVCQPPLQYYAVRFDIQQIADGQQVHLLREKLAPQRQVHVLGDKAIHKTLESLIREEQQDRHFAFPLQQALAQELFWRLLSELPEEILSPQFVKRTQQSELLLQLTRLFENHAGTSLRVNDMASALNMSESSLAHVCKELLGIGPAGALARFRMQKALMMLRHTHLSVKQIAAELGFHDESHFIHTFRKEQGKTPGTFRNQNPADAKMVVQKTGR